MMARIITGWAAFWLFITVLVLLDVAFPKVGLFHYTTPSEKKMKQTVIDEQKNKKSCP